LSSGAIAPSRPRIGASVNRSRREMGMVVLLHGITGFETRGPVMPPAGNALLIWS